LFRFEILEQLVFLFHDRSELILQFLSDFFFFGKLLLEFLELVTKVNATAVYKQRPFYH